MRELRLLTCRRGQLVSAQRVQEKAGYRDCWSKANPIPPGADDAFAVSGVPLPETLVLRKKTNPVGIGGLAHGSLKQKQEANEETFQGFQPEETRRFLAAQAT